MKKSLITAVLFLLLAIEGYAQGTAWNQIINVGTNNVDRFNFRVGHSENNTFGNLWGKYSYLGTQNLGPSNPPNTADLYGLSVSWSGDRGFVGMRNRGPSDDTANNNSDFIIAWGNDDGTSNVAADRMKFEYHHFNGAAPRVMMTGFPVQGTTNVDIGFGSINTPTEQIHSDRGVRFQGLISGGNITDLVGIDANGKLWRTSATGGVTLNCGTTDYVTKVTGPNTLDCSQIYDDGTSVGINSTGPFGFTVTTTNNVQPGPWSSVSSGTLQLDVAGITMSQGYLISSDARYKKNVTNVTKALDKITRLRGVYYNWKAEEFKSKNFTNATQLGFIAQEVKDVIPDIVYTDELGYNSVNYTALIPVLVEALKEQQLQIESLQSKFAKKSESSSVKSINGSENNAQGSRLFENRPNPFTKITTIAFDVSKDAKSAAIIIMDLQGKELHRETISRFGAGEIVFDAQNMHAGMYLYSLVVDGMEIDTKRMVVSK